MHLRRAAFSFVLCLGAGTLGACSSPSTQSTGLPASGAGSAVQSSYAYDTDSQDASRTTTDPSFLNPLASKLRNNETLGFGADKLLVFSYRQQFDCVVGPFSDLNSIGKPADIAPQQFASPECDIGIDSKLNPPGNPIAQTDTLFVLVPFFETDKHTPAFTHELGKALKKLFGFIPDAFKPNPGVPVQCPAPADQPGTCTMHPLQINLGPLVVALGLLPAGTNLYVPLVNHDHLVNNSNINVKPEWWKLVVVLVENPKAWPNAAGTTGITSVAKLRAAQASKEASADVVSNFFLYFNSYATHGSNQQMPKMPM
ncbi:MAG: hypothetical protein JOZ77_04220 [Candidatus Eremiobacteraeota bacterium]|nr:hypothetical protein [Candidatus Eremiobacteraeota bacterium]